jgi:hypothetical protein
MSVKKCFLTLAALAVLLVPAATFAQAVTAADAKPFLGSWTLMLETPQGSMPMTVTVKEDAGKVTSEMGSDMMPSTVSSAVAKAGAGLAFTYNMDMQGNAIPVQLTLTPAGEKMNFSLDFAGGQFMLDGQATKK